MSNKKNALRELRVRISNLNLFTGSVHASNFPEPKQAEVASIMTTKLTRPAVTILASTKYFMAKSSIPLVVKMAFTPVSRIFWIFSCQLRRVHSSAELQVPKVPW